MEIQSLKPKDRVKLALTDENFITTIAEIIEHEVFDYTSYIKGITPNEIGKLLEKITPHLRRLFLKFTYCMNKKIEAVQHLKSCDNLQEIHFAQLKHFHRQIFRDILTQNVTSLIVLSLRNCNVNSKMCETIGSLVNLQKLDLSDNVNLLTGGKSLGKLNRLIELNLSECRRFSADSMIEILKTANLESLNIHNCFRFDNSVIEYLVETQKSLKRIAISTTNRASNIHLIAKLPSLREIKIHSSCETGRIDSKLLEALVEDHKNSLESLELYNYAAFRYDPSYWSIIRSDCLKFPKLRKLCIVVGCWDDNFYENFLTDIISNCRVLEYLKIWGWQYVGPKDIVRAVDELKCLKELDLWGGEVDASLYSDILEATGNSRSNLLLLHVRGTQIKPKFLQTDVYRKGKHLVELSFDYRQTDIY